MSNETIHFDIIRPKKEPRPGPKKRITFDTKDVYPRDQRQNTNEKSESSKDDKKDKKGKGKSSTKQALPPLDDDSDNQGFSEWLRSGDGVDTMRLFVLANSILVIVTMAWPHMQQTISIIRELIFGEEDEY